MPKIEKIVKKFSNLSFKTVKKWTESGKNGEKIVKNVKKNRPKISQFVDENLQKADPKEEKREKKS